MSQQPGTGPSDESPNRDTLARYLVDESSPDEVKRVEAWLARDPVEHARIVALRNSMTRLRVPADKPVETERALAAVLVRRSHIAASTNAFAGSASHRKGLAPLLAIAASIVLVAVGVRWISSHELAPPPTTVVQQMETKIGEVDSVRLADGSLAVLGPMSRISISPAFGKAERNVVLRGQAYFDVTHDVRHRFTVQVGRTIIRDVGTAFTVRESPDGEVLVAVASGTVELTDSSASPGTPVLTIRENQAAIARNGLASLTSGPGQTSNAFEWMQRRLRFSDAAFADVASELGRWYGIEFRFADSSLRSRHLTASFDNEPVSQLLTVIGLVVDAEFVRNGNVVTVRARR